MLRPRAPASSWRFHPFASVRRAVVGFATRLLTKPLGQYTHRIPNDLLNLKRHIRKGDVVLVEGNERVSEVIKYLTQSSWSHAALYVGDEPLKRDPALAEKLIAQYGDDANFLVVEALVESGVVLSPLSKYQGFNIRVCRPYNLAPADLRHIMDEVLSEVGYTYDLKNVFDLLRYFLPVSLVPRRFRRKALQFGSGEPTRVICTSMIGEAFQRVGFPVVPSFRELPSATTPDTGGASFWRRRQRLDGHRFGVFQRVSPSLITPRDFDLSPYFEIVKFNIIEDLRFDYRKLLWADDEPDLATRATRK